MSYLCVINEEDIFFKIHGDISSGALRYNILHEMSVVTDQLIACIVIKVKLNIVCLSVLCLVYNGLAHIRESLSRATGKKEHILKSHITVASAITKNKQFEN